MAPFKPPGSWTPGLDGEWTNGGGLVVSAQGNWLHWGDFVDGERSFLLRQGNRVMTTVGGEAGEQVLGNVSPDLSMIVWESGDVWTRSRTPARQDNMDVVNYTLAMSSCEYTGDWKKAVKLLHGMPHRGLKPNVKTFNVAIGVCQRAGQWRAALALLRGMPCYRVFPDERTYALATAACESACDDSDEAKTELADMRARADSDEQQPMWPAKLAALPEPEQVKAPADLAESDLDCAASTAPSSAGADDRVPSNDALVAPDLEMQKMDGEEEEANDEQEKTEEEKEDVVQEDVEEQDVQNDDDVSSPEVDQQHEQEQEDEEDDCDDDDEEPQKVQNENTDLGSTSEDQNKEFGFWHGGSDVLEEGRQVLSQSAKSWLHRIGGLIMVLVLVLEVYVLWLDVAHGKNITPETREDCISMSPTPDAWNLENNRACVMQHNPQLP